MIKIGIMNKGDKVLTVTKEFVAVQRKNGEVDLVRRPPNSDIISELDFASIPYSVIILSGNPVQFSLR